MGNRQETKLSAIPRQPIVVDQGNTKPETVVFLSGTEVLNIESQQRGANGRFMPKPHTERILQLISEGHSNKQIVFSEKLSVEAVRGAAWRAKQKGDPRARTSVLESNARSSSHKGTAHTFEQNLKITEKSIGRSFTLTQRAALRLVTRIRQEMAQLGLSDLQRYCKENRIVWSSKDFLDKAILDLIRGYRELSLKEKPTPALTEIDIVLRRIRQIHPERMERLKPDIEKIKKALPLTQNGKDFHLNGRDEVVGEVTPYEREWSDRLY